MTKNILNDIELRKLLKKINSIVMIGVSASPLRASFFVARYFVLRGISVIPINPNYEGEYLWGEKVLGKISDIDHNKRVDLIDIFRPSKEVPNIVEDTIKYLKRFFSDLFVAPACFLRFLELSGCVRTCPDALGAVWMRSDDIETRSDMFGANQKFLCFSWDFLGFSEFKKSFILISIYRCCRPIIREEIRL